MKKLLTIAKTSGINQIKIKYGKEAFKFNLYKETLITESNIDVELKQNPAIYSFLTVLHKKLIKKYEDSEATKERKYAELFVGYKTGKLEVEGTSQRGPSDDLCKELVRDDSDYQKTVDDVIACKTDMETIGACVRAFEQRAFLLQTLSANNRSERNIESRQ